MTTLTILCSLCAHDRMQHTVVKASHAQPRVLFYCKSYCPCNGSATFQGKGTMQPSTRRIA